MYTTLFQLDEELCKKHEAYSLYRQNNQVAFDVLHDYATPYSSAVLCDLLGLPRCDGEALKSWSEFFFYLFASMPSEAIRDQLDQALEEFRAYIGLAVDQRRREPRRDLISAMLEMEIQGAKLTEAQVIDHCMLLFADGVENVDRCIATSVALLLEHTAQLDKLRREPSGWRAAVEECLRYESPAQYIGRVALEDVSLRGVTIPRDAAVLLVLGAANRDPRLWANPDQFDITRKGPAHLAFGKGLHSCLGGPLVKLEVEIALRVLFDAYPNLVLREAELQWTARPGHRWLSGLPVRVWL